MNRTDLLKLGYVAAILAVGGVAALLAWRLGGGVVTIGAIALALLVPGRVLGIFYRDLFRGRRLLDSSKLDDSICCTRRFLDHIRRHPRRKRLLWLAWSVYTTDAEAMALNNLGAAYLKAGDLAAADSALREALATDPKYPLPYYNLAIERAASDDPAEAQRLAAEARRLGYHGTAVDDLVRQAQTLLARVEGSVTADEH